MTEGQTGVIIQTNIFESTMGWLMTGPIFLLGIIILGLVLAVLFRRNKEIPKIRTTAVSVLMYYYLYVLFVNIVGIPVLDEIRRCHELGEPFFNPNINLIPLSDGFSLSFILNIFLFLPLGFFCPLLSRTFERAKYTFAAGLALSLFVEISQMFTMYRVSDINDLFANVAGTMIGYLCFRLAARLGIVKRMSARLPRGKDDLVYLPAVITAAAFVLGFFS